MELKHYRLIKTIAEEGSLANSSEKLFLTQSALSHQLRDIENQLGYKVFFRSRNKWELSEQGKELYALANKLFESIEEGLANISQINEGSKGSVRIGAECNSFFRGLPAFIQKIGILYPYIDVDIVLDATNQPLAKLLAGDIDMAIVTSRPPMKELNCIELYQDEIPCIMNAEHPFHELEYLEPSHFSEMHLIIHSFPMESVSVYQHFLKPNSISPKKISAIPFNSVTVEMIHANMGVSCIPLWLLESFRLSDQLIFKKLGRNGLKRTIYLAYRDADQSKQYISDFLSNIQEEYFK